MRTTTLVVMLIATLAFAQAEKAIMPVSSWPRVVNFDGKTYYDADVGVCVEAGYRMLTAKPATPVGKRIKSEKIIQDDKDSSKCKYDIMYEDIPEPVIPDPPVPEITTNIILGRLAFTFSTNGYWRGIEWLDAPQTNIAVGE